MEEIVWVIFGVIAIVISFALITRVVDRNSENNKLQEMRNSIQLLENQCNLVCEMGSGTTLGIDVNIASKSLLYSYPDTICFEFKEESICSRCNCEIKNPGVLLNLTFPEAEQLFDVHTYTCFFTKVSGGVTIECKG